MQAEAKSLRDEMQGEAKSLRDEMQGEAKSLRDEMQSEARSLRDEMHQGFDGLHRTLLHVGGGIIAALIGVIATQL